MTKNQKDLEWYLSNLTSLELEAILNENDQHHPETLRPLLPFIRDLLDLKKSLQDLASGQTPQTSSRTPLFSDLIQNITELISNDQHDSTAHEVCRHAELLRGLEKCHSYKDLANSFLSIICKNTSSLMGVVYIKDQESGLLKLMETYGCQLDDIPHTIHLGEGLLGQACKSQQKISLRGEHCRFFKISSSLGEAYPQEIVIIPIVLNGKLLGAFELASLSTYRSSDHQVLEVSSGLMASRVKNIADRLSMEKAMEELHNSHVMLTGHKEALDHSAIVAETDIAGRITYVNSKFMEISKYSEEELIGQDHKILNSGHHSHDFFKNLWKTISSGRVWQGEIKNKTKDGEIYWVDTTIFPLKDSSGNTNKYVAIRFEITFRKNIEDKLIQANQSIRNQKDALDAAAIVAETDHRGRITYINQKFLDISKYDRSDLLGKDHRIINSGYHPKDFFKKLWQTISQGDVWEGEICNRSKQGDLYWVHTTIFPIKNHHQKITGFVAIRFDITDRKMLQIELENQAKTIKNAASSKSTFLSNIGHELKNPINGIMGLTEILIEDLAQTNHLKHLRVIQECGNHLSFLLDDFLDITKAEEGKLELSIEKVCVKEMVHSSVDFLRRDAAKKNLSITIEFAEDLSNELYSDPIRLRQIILNLLSNAIKYTESGCISINVSGTKDRSAIVIEVMDTGIGIPEKEIESIFSRFYRLKKSERSSGSGLGLHITKALVEALKGKIDVTSDPGTGSTFRIVLPYRTQDSLPSVTTHPYLHPSIKHILIVDDYSYNLDILEKKLNRVSNATIYKANSGHEAVSLVQEHKIDLMILDINMPSMDGFSATQQIRDLHIHQPVIVAHTADYERDIKDKCLSSGMNIFLKKPLSEESLIYELKLFKEKKVA